MYKEVKKAGIKEFFLILLVLAVLSAVGSFVSHVLPAYKIIGHILGIVLIAIYGLRAVVPYCSVYHYIEREKCFNIIRDLGRRSKDLKIKYKDITYVGTSLPEGVKAESFSVTLLPKPTDLYITAKDGTAVRISDCDGRVRELLQSKMKG